MRAEEKRAKSTRNVGIELLRNLAMLFIVIMHLLGKSGAKDELVPGTPIWILTWTLFAVCIVGNNVFIIISGYFYKENKFKLYKIINMWLCVLGYSAGIAFIAKYVMGIELVSGFRNALFPIVKSEYWFMTVYIGLYCFMPYLKIIIEHMTIRMYGALLAICIVFFSVIPTVFQMKEWLNSGGYSGIVWFIFLYLLGAYVRNCNLTFLKLFSNSRWAWCLLILLLPLYKLVLWRLKEIGIEHRILENYANFLYIENSVIVLLVSVVLVVCFSSITIKSIIVSKVITFLGSGCIGVYLIHNNRNISHFLWEELRVNYWLAERRNILIILLIATSVFLVCNLIEHLRQYIFKLLKIDKLIIFTSNKITERIQL